MSGGTDNEPAVSALKMQITAMREVLERLQEALEAKDFDAMDVALAQAQSLPSGGETRGVLSEIADGILTSDARESAFRTADAQTRYARRGVKCLHRVEEIRECRSSNFASVRSHHVAAKRTGPNWPELALSWLFCNRWNEETYFDVLFDGSTGIVRTTQQRPNDVGWDGVAPSCGH
jgi:hypothetical protein